MLKELQEFASTGCIDIAKVRMDTIQLKQLETDDSATIKLLNEDYAKEKRFNVLELITKLRLQMEDLEKFAFENGQMTEMPLRELKQRQVRQDNRFKTPHFLQAFFVFWCGKKRFIQTIYRSLFSINFNKKFVWKSNWKSVRRRSFASRSNTASNRF